MKYFLKQIYKKDTLTYDRFWISAFQTAWKKFGHQLITQSKLVETEYEGQKFYLRNPLS
jgi:hypothetical protein